MRRSWRRLALVLLGAIAVAPLAWLLSQPVRWFLLGVWLATVAASLVHVVIVASGSVRLSMAAEAELWTRSELARSHRTGWRVAHRVLFRRNEDIDTIAIGSPGVVVIETKWSSTSWAEPTNATWIAAAVAQAQRNANLVERQIRQQVGAAPVHAVVVLWPAERGLTSRHVDGVVVLAGDQLRAWIGSLTAAVMPPEAVEKAWSFLTQHIERRDAYELAANGPGPRTSAQLLAAVAMWLAGALAGTMVLAATLSLFTIRLALLVTAFAVGLLSIGLRLPPVRSIFAGAILAICAVLVGSAVATLYQILIR